MGVPYDFAGLEYRWRARWEEAGLYRLDLDAVDPEDLFYNLVEFPYPSAEGLHVGHIFKYSGADAYGRYQRMQGRAVFQPDRFRRLRHPYRELRPEGRPTSTARDRADDRDVSRSAVAGRDGLGLVPGCGHEPTRLLPLDSVDPYPAVRSRADVSGRRPGVVVPVMSDRAGQGANRDRRGRERVRALRHPGH